MMCSVDEFQPVPAMFPSFSISRCSCLVISLLGLPLVAQESPPEGPLERKDLEGVHPTDDIQVIEADDAIEILGPIDRVIFPPPPPPKAKLLPVMKELKRLERRIAKSEKLITRWIEPIEADFTPPSLPDRGSEPELTEDEIAALLELYGREKWLSISATVFDERVTLLRWSHEGTKYWAWSNVHFGHLSGLGQFKLGKQRYSLWMGWGKTRSEWVSEDDWPGKPPELPDEPAQFEPIGEVPDEALETITVLHKVYAREGERLAKIYEKRQRANEAWRAWKEANPPQPQDIEVVLWPSKTARFMTRPIPYEDAKIRERLSKGPDRGQEVLAKIEAEKQRWNNVPVITVDP